MRYFAYETIRRRGQAQQGEQGRLEMIIATLPSYVAVGWPRWLAGDGFPSRDA